MRANPSSTALISAAILCLSLALQGGLEDNEPRRMFFTLVDCFAGVSFFASSLAVALDVGLFLSRSRVFWFLLTFWAVITNRVIGT